MKIAIALLCLTLAACSGTSAFYKAHPPAESPQSDKVVQFNKKLLQHHNVIGKEIIALRNDPSVSQGSKDALLAGYRKTVCSDEERDTSVITANCREGASWRLDHATAAWEALQSAPNEVEMQAASDELARDIADLIDLIGGIRS